MKKALLCDTLSASAIIQCKTGAYRLSACRQVNQI